MSSSFVFESFRIIKTSPKIFLSIFTILTLPLSLLIFSLILNTSPIRQQISLKSDLAVSVTTRFESLTVWEQVQAESITLLQLKALYFLPSYALSLLATVTAVDTAALAASGQIPSLKTAVSAGRVSWMRPLVTSICVYALMCAYYLTIFSFSSLVDTTNTTLLVFRAVLEVYFMAVFAMGVVVSVVEERFGWEAVSEGWVLVGERRFSGWVLAGFLVTVSGGIGWGFERMMAMDGQDFLMGVMGKIGLVCLFGFVVVWSCVVNTAFYSDCKRLYVERMEIQHSV